MLKLRKWPANGIVDRLVGLQDIETMDLEEYKYNKANITAFGLVKSNSQFYKSVALNLTDYYQMNSRDQDRTSVLLNVSSCCFLAELVA